MIDWLMATSIGCSVLGLLFMLAGVASARRRRFVRLSVHITLALACLASGALFLTLHLSLQGYRALTREDLPQLFTRSRCGRRSFASRFTWQTGRRTATGWRAMKSMSMHVF